MGNLLFASFEGLFGLVEIVLTIRADGGITWPTPLPEQPIPREPIYCQPCSPPVEK